MEILDIIHLYLLASDEVKSQIEQILEASGLPIESPESLSQSVS